MLHRQEKAGLVVITQPTHAWVAGCLARAWGNQLFGSFTPREEVCLGAEQHDIGWLTWENAPTLNPKTGYPHNFMELPTQTHLGIWSGAKQLTLPYGRYVALLVSLHGTGLYERNTSWQKSPDSCERVKKFLEGEYAFQEQLIGTLQQEPYYAPCITPEVIGRNRSLVRSWDALSLILCHGLYHEQQLDRVPTASGETTLTLTPVDDDSTQVEDTPDFTSGACNENFVKVSPWPFQPNEVNLVYEGRVLRQPFTDETAMHSALIDADWVTIRTTLMKSDV